MRTISKFSFLTILTLTLFACSTSKKVPPASSGHWEKLGEKSVDYRIDHDVFNVTYRNGYFSKLRFSARGGAVNVYRCVVHFENGGTQEIDLRHDLAKGNRSRMVDLSGNRRLIEKVTFWYDTKNSSRNRAIVSVWGR